MMRNKQHMQLLKFSVGFFKKQIRHQVSLFFLISGWILLFGSCQSVKKTKLAQGAMNHTNALSDNASTAMQVVVVDSSIVYEPDTGDAAKDGYASMRIPALIRTQKGTLLAFCEGRLGSSSDWTPMNLLLRRSLDDGKTWKPAQIIAPKGQGPTSNPTPILSADGTIHLLYQRDYARAYYTKSTDEGKTWSKAIDITSTVDQIKGTYPWNVLAPGPGHGIQLKNGRLLAPIWLANSPVLGAKRKHGPSCVATIYSDDLGKTWKMGTLVADNSPAIKNPNESVLAELNDGRVIINIRSGSKRHLRAVATSPDGISQWSQPVFDTALFDPVCMAGMIRWTPPARLFNKKVNRQAKKTTDTWLAFSNPDSRDIAKHPRKNLTLKLSPDGGKTWPVAQVINPGASGYSDLAQDQKGNIYCLYETNTKGKGWNYSLVLKKIQVRSGK